MRIYLGNVSTNSASRSLLFWTIGSPFSSAGPLFDCRTRVGADLRVGPPNGRTPCDVAQAGDGPPLPLLIAFFTESL